MRSNKHKYEYRINAGSVGERAVRLVGREKKVLELGPGPGTITRILARESGCRITALEFDAEAIPKLSPYCECVHRADLNDPAWPELVRQADGFDVVVATDVLEHLYEPLKVLTAMKGMLNEHGYIVVSLPHVGHSAIHACLLDEDFSYSEIGLLDRTHIRFFGIKNIQRLFEDAGLKIVHAEFVVREPEHTEFAKLWARTDPALRNALAKNPFGSVYQVVVKAVPLAAEGEAVVLMDLAVERQRLTLADHMKAFLRVHVSKKLYSKLQGVYATAREYFAKDKY